MKNMKMSKAEAKTMLGGPVSTNDAPAYPYGLSISLDDASMKKLGMTEMMPVGRKCRMNVICEVTGTSARQEQDGDTNKRVEMQITDMEMVDDGKENDRAAAMYPSMAKK